MTAPASRHQTARPAALLVLLIGPLLSVMALQAWFAVPGTSLHAAPLSMYLLVAVLVWSPLPFSLPAVLLERARDEALPGYRGLGRLRRAALLVPHMLTRSSARVEFAASLVGFAGAVAAAAPHVF